MLLDLDMPGVSGFDVLEALRRDRDLPEIHVVILTGLGGHFPALEERTVLWKPCSADALLEAVARHGPPRERT
jgi:CheY-like chemotaxis protein